LLNELQVELAERKRTDIDTVPGHTTINVGIVTGGTAGNILAASARSTGATARSPATTPGKCSAAPRSTSPNSCCPR